VGCDVWHDDRCRPNGWQTFQHTPLPINANGVPFLQAIFLGLGGGVGFFLIWFYSSCNYPVILPTKASVFSILPQEHFLLDI